MCRWSICRIVVVCFVVLMAASPLPAQVGLPVPDEATAELPVFAEVPKIADEPKTIDPATFMPPLLAAKGTVELSDASLGELLDWLRKEHKLVILAESESLSDMGVYLGDPISDRLADAPIYLLLNRLQALDIGWYVEDEVLHITSIDAAYNQQATFPHNVGDLLDAGYDAEALKETIFSVITPESWDEVGGTGAVNPLGDVIFIRQTDEVQREIRGLLAALRKHGRRTFTLDPPQHESLRAKLEEKVTLPLRDTPLDAAVAQLAKETGIDIRLDLPALRDIGLRQREPITLSLADRPLRTVLQAMLLDLDLTWVLRDGVLWITSTEEANTFTKTAVFDVRDLCRNGDEADALIEAITVQTDPNAWDDVGGVGTVQSPLPGTLVVSNTEKILGDVLDLLETYRTALRSSKPRQSTKDDPNEVVTVYYRLHTNMARDLMMLLPRLLRPDSWKTQANPDAPGELHLVSSAPELTEIQGKSASNAETKQPAQSLVISRSTLIIRHTREAHEKIRDIIQRVQFGDGNPMGMGGMGMGGMGGRGNSNNPNSFGGGFFSIPSRGTADVKE